MTIEFQKLIPFSSSILTVYSVKIDEEKDSEFQKFIDADFHDTHPEEIEIIYEILERIKGGAKKYYFRNENDAEAIPGYRFIPQEIIDANKNDDYGIRLYCVRITENIVILLNGGIKTTNNPQDCPNVRNCFLIANKIGRWVNKQLDNRDLDISNPNCFQNISEEI